MEVMYVKLTTPLQVSIVVSLWDALEAHYLYCYWCESCFSYKVSLTPSLCWPVHPFTGRCGACLSGPGPSVPALLFHFSVLPTEKKWGAAQCWLLLHSLVCYHCNACLQVSINTGLEGHSPVVLLVLATLHWQTHRQLYRTRQDISQPMTKLGLICMLSGQQCTQGKAID